MSLVYVFSVNSSLEALYELDNEGNVEKPIHMTGNYPMGTFLSCAIEMLTQWRNDGYSILNCDTLLSVICDRYVNTPSSYGSALRSDSTAKAFLGQLLNMSYFVAEHKKSIEHLDEVYEDTTTYGEYYKQQLEEDIVSTVLLYKEAEPIPVKVQCF